MSCVFGFWCQPNEAGSLKVNTWKIMYMYLNCEGRYEGTIDYRSYTAPSQLDSSVGRALQCTGITEVNDGFESHSRLNFFQALTLELLKLYV